MCLAIVRWLIDHQIELIDGFAAIGSQDTTTLAPSWLPRWAAPMSQLGIIATGNPSLKKHNELVNDDKWWLVINAGFQFITFEHNYGMIMTNMMIDDPGVELRSAKDSIQRLSPRSGQEEGLQLTVKYCEYMCTE